MRCFKKKERLLIVSIIAILIVASFVVYMNFNNDVFLVNGLKYDVSVTDLKSNSKEKTRLVKVRALENKKYKISFSLLNEDKTNYEVSYDLYFDNKTKEKVIDESVLIYSYQDNISGMIKKDYKRQIVIEVNNTSDKDYYVEFRINASIGELALENKVQFKGKSMMPRILAVVNGINISSFPKSNNYVVELSCFDGSGDAVEVDSDIEFVSNRGWTFNLRNILSPDTTCRAVFKEFLQLSYGSLINGVDTYGPYSCANYNSMPSNEDEVPILSYTGNCTLTEGLGSGNWKMKFTTSGTLSLARGIIFDAFLVGGGGGGGSHNDSYGGGAGGGGGGYTQTHLSQIILNSGEYPIAVGAGGAVGENGGQTSFTTEDNVLTANGGFAGYSFADQVNGRKGGDGGSGGGGGVAGILDGTGGVPSAGLGGSNGGSGSLNGGMGQGTNTCEFGEISLGSGFCEGGLYNLYSGGGGGGGSCKIDEGTIGGIWQSFCKANSRGVNGGSGGGGKGAKGEFGNDTYAHSSINDGTPNTGGGGGGAIGAGGSGVVVIRKAKGFVFQAID